MNNKKMKNSLQKSLIRISVIIVIFISISVGTLCFDIYRRDMISKYQNYAGDAINFLSSCIDVDDLEECMRTGVKSDKYNELQTLANNKGLSPWEAVSAAIGYATYDSDKDASTINVFKRADNNMYENKKRMHAERT